jgi:hypothetical protein
MYQEAAPDVSRTEDVLTLCLNRAVVTDECEAVVKWLLEWEEQRQCDKYLLRPNFLSYELAKAS